MSDGDCIQCTILDDHNRLDFICFFRELVIVWQVDIGRSCDQATCFLFKLHRNVLTHTPSITPFPLEKLPASSSNESSLISSLSLFKLPSNANSLTVSANVAIAVAWMLFYIFLLQIEFNCFIYIILPFKWISVFFTILLLFFNNPVYIYKIKI